MRIGLYGFGSIGRLVAKVALERGHEIVGVVDIDPNIVGRDVGEVLGVESLGIEVSSEPVALADADIVIHATKSYLDEVYDQLLAVINMGIDVISTCETLVYPYYRYPVLARRLNEYAILNDVFVLGAGINPGFLLDTLIITLSAPVTAIRRVKAVRSVDAGKRREAFKRKIGIGLEPTEFKSRLERRELTGHVGYAESVMLIADSANMHLDKVTESQELVVAGEEVKYGDLIIGKGKVIGIKGYGAGFIKGNEIIRLEFHAYLGACDYEEIVIEGVDYSIVWRSNGTPGDLGTASILISIAEKSHLFPAGLLTMADILPFKPYFRI